MAKQIKPSRKTVRSAADTDRSLIKARRQMMLDQAEQAGLYGDDEIASMYFRKAMVA